MRKFHKHTNYIRPEFCRGVTNEANSPGSVVQVGMTWYRITPSGNWRKAIPQETSDEIIKREIASMIKTKVNDGKTSLSR